MADVYDVKIKRLKIFFNRKDYLGMSRKEYLNHLIKKNPEDYKKFLILEYSDEMIVYTSWYMILLVLSGVLIVASIFICSLWYIFLCLSLITLIVSKRVRDKLGKMLTGMKFFISIINNRIEREQNKEV